jgi:hypothetical protein
MIIHSFQPRNNAALPPLSTAHRAARLFARSRHAVLLLFLPFTLVICCWQWGRAQTPAPPVHLHLVDINADDYPNITAYVSVVGANGLPLETLMGDDFVIWEDDAPLEPAPNLQVARDSALPLKLVLLLDITTRDPNKWEPVRQAVHRLIDSLNPQDDFATYIYTNTVSPLHGFGETRAEAHRLLDTVVDPPLYSAFNDAIEKGVAVANDTESGRKAVIMIIDRLDNVGRTRACDFNPPQASATQAARPVPVYIFAYDSCAAQQRRVIEQTAQARGGKAFFFATATEIEQTLVTLPLLLRQGYQVRYTSNKPANSQNHGLAVALRNLADVTSVAGKFTAQPRPLSVEIKNRTALTTVSGAVPIDLSITAPGTIQQVAVGLDDKSLFTNAGGINGALIWDSATAEPGLHTLWFTVTDVVGNRGSTSATVIVAAPLVINDVAVRVCPPSHEQDEATAAACTNGLPPTIAYGSKITVTATARGVFAPTQASLHFFPPTTTLTTTEKPLLVLSADVLPGENDNRFRFIFTHNGRLLRAGDYQLAVAVRAPGSFQGAVNERTQPIGVTALRLPPRQPSCWQQPLVCFWALPVWVHSMLATLFALLLLLLLWPFWRAFLRWQRGGWYVGYLITLTNQGNCATTYEIQVRSEAPLLRFTFLLHGKVLLPPDSNRKAPTATADATGDNALDHRQLPSVVAAPRTTNDHVANGAGNPGYGHGGNGASKANATVAGTTGQKKASTGAPALDTVLAAMDEGAQLLSGLQRYLPREVAAPLGQLSGGLRSWRGRLQRGRQDAQHLQRRVTKLTGKNAAWFELTPPKSTQARQQQERQRVHSASTATTMPIAQPEQGTASSGDYELGTPLLAGASSALSTGWTATPLFRPGEEEKIYLLITAARRPRTKEILLTVQSRPTAALGGMSEQEQKAKISLQQADWRRQRT